MDENEKKNNEIANAIADQLNAQVLVYSGPIDARGFGGLIAAIEITDQQPYRPNTVMFLTTYGGDADQAYRIARLMHNVTTEFHLCVPSTCKSAGTLIALGAHVLYVTAVSELGPLDVQLVQRDEIAGRRSGMVVRTALNGLADEVYKVYERVMIEITKHSGQAISFDLSSHIASQIATGVMAPVYGQIDPESLGKDLRDLSIATEYGNRLVEYGKNASKETVRKLVEDYPSHGFIIDHREANKLFNRVEEPTPEMFALSQALGEIVYTVKYPHFIKRIDGNFASEEDQNERSENTGPEPTSVAERRETKGGGDHKGERKTTKKSRESSKNTGHEESRSA